MMQFSAGCVSNRLTRFVWRLACEYSVPLVLVAVTKSNTHSTCTRVVSNQTKDHDEAVGLSSETKHFSLAAKHCIPCHLALGIVLLPFVAFWCSLSCQAQWDATRNSAGFGKCCSFRGSRVRCSGQVTVGFCTDWAARWVTLQNLTEWRFSPTEEKRLRMLVAWTFRGWEKSHFQVRIHHVAGQHRPTFLAQLHRGLSPSSRIAICLWEAECHELLKRPCLHHRYPPHDSWLLTKRFWGLFLQEYPTRHQIQHPHQTPNTVRWIIGYTYQPTAPHPSWKVENWYLFEETAVGVHQKDPRSMCCWFQEFWTQF